jgi:hypothetical protein
MNDFHLLINNGAFWGFMGTVVVAFFGYRGLLVPYIEDQKRKKYTNGNGDGNYKMNIKRVTSFDELKAVVEILQNELDRKDKMMQRQDERHRIELKGAYTRIDELYEEIDKLKERLHKAHINEE